MEEIIRDQAIFCYPCDSNNQSNPSQSQDNQMISHVKTSVSSISLRIPGIFDLKKFQGTLDRLVYMNNTTNNDSSSSSPHLTSPIEMKIYRMKGLIRTTSSSSFYILQAVHNMFDIHESNYQFGGEDDFTQGLNLIIIIGVNLRSDFFEEELSNCIYKS
jgi:G3E family GTPase